MESGNELYVSTGRRSGCMTDPYWPPLPPLQLALKNGSKENPSPKEM